MSKNLKILAAITLGMLSLTIISFLIMAFTPVGGRIFTFFAMIQAVCAVFFMGIVVDAIRKQNPFRRIKKAKNEPVEITWEEFITYEPVNNHIKPIDSYNGCLFLLSDREIYEVELWDYHQVWTLIDESGDTYIIPGYHIVNRLGYFLTKKPWTSVQITVIV